MIDSKGMIRKLEGMQALGERDIELHESRNFGICGGGVDGSVGTVFWIMLFVCGRGALSRSVFLQWKMTSLF